jgi:hypothetical protein
MDHSLLLPWQRLKSWLSVSLLNGLKAVKLRRSPSGFCFHSLHESLAFSQSQEGSCSVAFHDGEEIGPRMLA